MADIPGGPGRATSGTHAPQQSEVRGCGVYSITSSARTNSSGNTEFKRPGDLEPGCRRVCEWGDMAQAGCLIGYGPALRPAGLSSSAEGIRTSTTSVADPEYTWWPHRQAEDAYLARTSSSSPRRGLSGPGSGRRAEW